MFHWEPPLSGLRGSIGELVTGVIVETLFVQRQIPPRQHVETMWHIIVSSAHKTKTRLHLPFISF